MCKQDQSNRADDERDSKNESKSQIDSVRGSKYSGHPPTSPSNDSAAGRQAAAYSKRQNSKGEVRFIFLSQAKAPKLLLSEFLRGQGIYILNVLELRI